ncbi:hypothetical protein MMC20_003288 [Loxospora ochrophaea]|nr:hypothetical protein [Loxospora ochrophaea]
MEISNPLRILLLTPPETPILPFITSLLPTPPSTPLLSLPSHLPLSTPYYTASIPLWHDTIPSPSAWLDEWLRTPETPFVVRAVGAWLVVLTKPSTAADLAAVRTLLSAIHAVIRHASPSSSSSADTSYASYGAEDPLMLVVGLPQSKSPSLDIELMGMARVKEVLEANEWEGGDEDGGMLEDLGLGDEEEDRDGEEGFREVAGEVEREMFGMRMAVHGTDEDEDDGGGEERAEELDNDDGGDIEVEELQRMMLRVQAIKDKGAGMQESERKRFAAKAIADIMKSK